MTEPEHPKVWVKVVEAHAIKTWIALVLTIGAVIALDSIAIGAVWNTVANPEVTDLSSNFMTLLGTLLGSVFGGILGYLGGQEVTKRKNGNGNGISEGNMTLHVDDPNQTKEGWGIRDKAIQVYGKPGCVQCRYTTKVLADLHVPYRYIDITLNPVAEEHVKSLGYSSVPVVDTGSAHWSGFRPDRLRSIND